jgi:soluble lytic murein transglycosylase-like protein
MKGDRPLRSRAGAMGLMQLMPETWAELRDKYGLGSNPHDPHDNVFAGTAYLSDLKARYGYPAMFIAYNHGPGNLERHLATNNTLPRETRDYVAAITANLGTSRTEPRRRAMQRAGTPALRLASFIAAD